MNLKEYLINCILEEKEIVNELLYIDNKIQHTSFGYKDLVDTLKKVDVCNGFDNEKEYLAITDGEINNVFKIIISVAKINIIFVNKTYLGINKYLVSRTNNFYGEDLIKLDMADNYKKYFNSNFDVIISGFDNFVEEASTFFKSDLII